MTNDHEVRAPIEYREAVDVSEVNYAQRLITVVAVPYEQRASVIYGGEAWDEIFTRGAFDGIEKRPNRVRVNRDHNRSRTIGKAVKFFPSREEGLVSDIRIGQTDLGDETLALAAEDMLSASIGFGVRGSDQRLDKKTKTRRINTAYLDHIAMVEQPAYDGAEVIAVRQPDQLPALAKIPHTPELDKFLADDDLRWAAERLNTK